LYQHRGHVRTVAPAVEPVTADELRAQLFETGDTLPDATANDLIAEAREMIEEFTGLALITQTWRLALDNWPGGREMWWDGMRQMPISEIYAKGSLRAVELPRYPLQSVSSVTVFDDADNGAVVNVAAAFVVDPYRKPGRMVLRDGATWPVALRAANAIEVVYVAGYGASATAVPAALKRAVKQVAAYLYTHNGDGCTVEDALAGARQMLDAYSVKRI
jgi:hypothetical protein